MSATRHKSVALRIKSAGDPSADQLTRINLLTLAELPPEQLYVRTFALAHNAIDRDDEAFDEAALADFARTLPGKGLFIKHPSGWDGDSGPGRGRWFEAEIQRMPIAEARTMLRAPDLKWPPGVETAAILMAGAYLVRSPGNADLLMDIDAGIASDVSIGFEAKHGGHFTDAEGREMSSRRLTAPAEALEGSLVWLGAQPGARAVKGAKPTPENAVTVTKEMLDAETAKVTNLQSQLDAAKPSHDIVIKARAALGDHAHLLDKPELLSEAAKAAATHRANLIDEIIAGERHFQMVGDDEEAVTAAKAHYAGEKLDGLERMAKHYRTRMPAGGKMAPSDPNVQKSTDTPKGVLATNPAFGGAVSTS